MRGKDRDLVGGDGGGGSLDLVEPFLIMWVWWHIAMDARSDACSSP